MTKTAVPTTVACENAPKFCLETQSRLRLMSGCSPSTNECSACATVRPLTSLIFIPSITWTMSALRISAGSTSSRRYENGCQTTLPPRETQAQYHSDLCLSTPWFTASMKLRPVPSGLYFLFPIYATLSIRRNTTSSPVNAFATYTTSYKRSGFWKMMAAHASPLPYRLSHLQITLRTKCHSSFKSM